MVNEHGELEVKQYVLPQHRVTDKEAAEMVEAYLHGRTTYELAERYGCNRHAVVYALKKNGITATKAKAQKKLDVPMVLAMYESYHTTDEIASTFGVSRPSILKCLKDNGVKIRSRWDYPRK